MLAACGVDVVGSGDVACPAVVITGVHIAARTGSAMIISDMQMIPRAREAVRYSGCAACCARRIALFAACGVSVVGSGDVARPAMVIGVMQIFAGNAREEFVVPAVLHVAHVASHCLQFVVSV